MKVLFDTSVLVAAVVELHPRHPQAFPWLKRAHQGELELVVCAHTLAELFAVLSTLPVRPRIAPATARHLIEENIHAHGRVVALSGSVYRKVIGRAADLGVGGAVYDALIAWVAQKVNADRLLTLNRTDFLRVWPQGNDRIHSPYSRVGSISPSERPPHGKSCPHIQLDW